MKIANVQEMVIIDKSNKWFHGRRFFQVVSHLHVVTIIQDGSSTSDPQLKIGGGVPIRAQDYHVNDPCYDIGGGVPAIGIKVKDPMCGISRAISGVIPTYVVVSIKNEDSRLNHLPQCKPLHQ
jgi:hypothetical protein